MNSRTKQLLIEIRHQVIKQTERFEKVRWETIDDQSHHTQDCIHSARSLLEDCRKELDAALKDRGE